MTNLTTKPNHFDAHERSTITPDATTLGAWVCIGTRQEYVLNCLQRIDKPSRHSSTSALSLRKLLVCMRNVYSAPSRARGCTYCTGIPV
jgi:hypothetical protein